MTHEEMEREGERLARALGGGWRWEQGLIVKIELSLPEAQALEKRLEA